MSTRVNREILLQCLESVHAGVSKREVAEQSNCFVFRDGYALTYNDEISCRCKSPLPDDLTGAVAAEPLLKILRKLEEEGVEIVQSDDELIVQGKRRKAGVRMEAEVTLPVDNIVIPKKWGKLHDDFCDAIGTVHQCAGKDESKFYFTCVHLHPDHVEACDNLQICHWPLQTGLTKPALVKKIAARHVKELGMTEFAESPTWLHFRNPNGLILSCRRYEEEYPNLKPMMKVDNPHPATLPKGLEAAAEKAQIFSGENPDTDIVSVELRPGKIRIRGQGASGWFQEVKTIVYDGEPMTFQIAPTLLIDIVKRFQECKIGTGRLIVDVGPYQYVTCLGVPTTEKNEEADNGEEESEPAPKKKKTKKRETVEVD